MYKLATAWGVQPVFKQSWCVQECSSPSVLYVVSLHWWSHTLNTGLDWDKIIEEGCKDVADKEPEQYILSIPCTSYWCYLPRSQILNLYDTLLKIVPNTEDLLSEVVENWALDELVTAVRPYSFLLFLYWYLYRWTLQLVNLSQTTSVTSSHVFSSGRSNFLTSMSSLLLFPMKARWLRDGTTLSLLVFCVCPSSYLSSIRIPRHKIPFSSTANLPYWKLLYQQILCSCSGKFHPYKPQTFPACFYSDCSTKASQGKEFICEELLLSTLLAKVRAFVDILRFQFS